MKVTPCGHRIETIQLANVDPKTLRMQKGQLKPVIYPLFVSAKTA
jgi:hypothetical protein